MSDSSRSNPGSLSSEELLDRLKSALRKDGDFPASAKIVSELRTLVSNPNTTGNQITEVILREPSLGTRVLHMVNSSFYRRAKPIMTVSQAVVQIGMKPLAELCTGLILMQKFVPNARRGGAFSACLQKTILTSLMTSSFGEQQRSVNGVSSEHAYLAGSFAEIGPLLLAYYFPQIYEAALNRSRQKRVGLEQGIHEITGITSANLSLTVLEALNLPEFYRDLIKVSSAGDSSKNPLAQIVNTSRSISSALVFSKDRKELDSILEKATKDLGLDVKQISKVMSGLTDSFKNHCMSLDLQLPALPEFIATPTPSQSGTQATNSAPVTDDFSGFINEVRQAVENREPVASVITTVMESIAWGLKFDRVLLLLCDQAKKNLKGRMLLGKADNFDARKFIRPISNAHAIECIAFRESRPVMQGEPILEGGWPLISLPIGFADRAIGVIYADRIGTSQSELSPSELAALSVLAELLDRAVAILS